MSDLKRLADDDKVVRLLEPLRAATIKQRGNNQAAGDLCPDCDGYGNQLTCDGNMRECHCRKERRTLQRLITAGIPKRYADQELDNFKTWTHLALDALRQVNRFVNNYQPRARGLMLHGQPGTGKTHLAVGALKAVIRKGYTGAFSNVVSLIDALKATFDPSSETTQTDLIESYLECELLVLDDLGAERFTKWWGERMYGLINSRYERGDTLIVNTNLSRLDLEEKVGLRVYSRLVEMCQEIDCGDQDFRIQKFTADHAPGEEGWEAADE